MSRSTPEAKFASDPCSARPTARPAAPIRAMNEVVWIPSWASAARTTNARIAKYTRLSMNETSVASISLRPIILRVTFRTAFAAQRPITRIRRAAMAL